MLITENPHGENFGRQATSDVVHALHRDLTGRRGKHETDCVGTHGNRQESIVLGGDAANLDEHRNRRYYATRSERRDVAMSEDVTSDSPTRTAS